MAEALELDLSEKRPVVTTHHAAGLDYEAETGFMPLADESGQVQAEIFYTAYTLKPRDPKRPIIFTFNGGPGSPSLWLHLGALGPMRVKMMPDGGQPAPPYELVENPETWLRDADLVFIDPVGTGWSRGRTLEKSAEHWGLQGDLDGVAEFIRLYLGRARRWRSPLYIAGESYGTTRGAGLAGKLVERGITLNGLILVSSILNFQTARFSKGNDLPYPLFLPTYTATAHYHGSIGGDLQTVLAESREFALGAYWTALAKGDGLQGEDRAAVRSRLSALTGLSEDYLEQCDLRPVIHNFCKELLRSKGKTVGRLDSRFTGIDAAEHGMIDRAEHDPSMSLLMGPYRTLYCAYAGEQLKFHTDRDYEIFGGIKKPWNWGSAADGHPDVSEALRKAVARNPYMKVFVASGLYDLATPFFATEFTLSHLGLPQELKANFTVKEYEAGHMMYIHEPSLSQLAEDIREFMKLSLPSA
jgi:carboxypeptidase C (cathepsin A)